MRKKFFIYGFLLFLIVLAIYLYTKRGFLLVQRYSKKTRNFKKLSGFGLFQIFI
jgi:hypothetical protein